MKVEDFIRDDKKGFSVAYIDHPTLMGEDIQEYLSGVPHIVVHCIDGGVFGLGSVVKTISQYLKPEDYKDLEGLVGKVIKSLYPEAKVNSNPYKDVHGSGVYLTTAHLMNKVAQYLETEKLVWVIDEFPLNEENDLWLFLKEIQGLESNISHKIIAISHKPYMPFATPLEYPDKKSQDTTLPKGKEGKTLRMLALLSFASYGYMRRTVAYSLVSQFDLDKGYIRLRDKGIVEEINGYVRIPNRALWEKAIASASKREIKMVLDFILSQTSSARLFTAAFLHLLMDDYQGALRYARKYLYEAKKEGIPREGQRNISPLFIKLKEHATIEDWEALINIAAASGYVDDLVKEGISHILGQDTISPHTAIDIAWLGKHLDKKEISQLIYTIKSSVNKSTPEEETLFGYALLGAYFAFGTLHIRHVQEAMLHIRREYIEDPDIKIKAFIMRSRVYIWFDKYTQGLKDILDGIKTAIDNKMDFHLGILYNNLVYTLKQMSVENDLKLAPILKKSLELAFLYGDIERSTVSLQNYVALAGESGAKYENLQYLVETMYKILKPKLTAESIANLLHAEAIIHLNYGYIDKANKTLDKVTTLLETDDIDKLTRSIYLFLRYSVYKKQLNIPEARHYLYLYRETMGDDEDLRNIDKALQILEEGNDVSDYDSFTTYASAIKSGNISKGIDILRKHLWNNIKDGNLLSSAYDELYLANLYTLSGNPYVAKKHTFFSSALSIYMQIAHAKDMMKKAGIPRLPSNPPHNSIFITLLDRHSGYVIGKISEASTLEEFLENILKYIPVPSFSSWVQLTSGNKKYYREHTLIKDIFPGFYKGPRAIYKMIENHGIGHSPSYMYVKLTEGDTTIMIYTQNLLVDGIFEEKHLMALSVWAENILTKASRLAESGKILIDEDTGLYSSWYIRHRLSKEFERAKREKGPLSVVVVGISKSTYLSDMWQEDIMKAVGNLISTNIREIDIAGRIGKEEILIILPNTPGHEAELVARRIVEKGKALRSLGISLYAGIDSIDYPPRYKRSDSLISGATLALRRAISTGIEISAYKDGNI